MNASAKASYDGLSSLDLAANFSVTHAEFAQLGKGFLYVHGPL